MKRVSRRLLAGCLALACAAVLLAAGLGATGQSVRVLRYLSAGESTHIFIDSQGSPTIMRGAGGREEVFAGLTTGDRVLVVCGAATDAVFPERSVASWCLRLGDGGPEELPQDTLTQLAELGWLTLPL